uniref:Uncharacterized protein n=1 Tax=Tanacetum cinerariifolium TaxID=118510 RepID=A0A6L2L7Z7_TANCI|nr:hypothetical protein [Tanacetum cinerariifolium]
MQLGKFLLRRLGSSRSLLLPNSRLSQLLPKNLFRRVSELKELPKRPLLSLTTGVVIRDTPGNSVSKTKAISKSDRGKGIELLSNATLLKDAQLKETLRKCKQEPYKLQASSSSGGADFELEVLDEQTDKTKEISEGTCVKPRVPDVSKEDSSDSDDDSWGDSEDENDDAMTKTIMMMTMTDSDDDENPSFTLKDYKEEEQDELYGDLNITQGLRYNDLTNAQQGREDQLNASHESGFVQEEEEDAHVTLTTVHDKTEGPLQSSSISSDFTSKLLNPDDLSSDINSSMNTSIVPPPPPLVYHSSHPTTIPQQQTPDSKTTTTYPTITLPEIPNFTSLFQLDQRVSALEIKCQSSTKQVNLLKLSPQFLALLITILLLSLKKK